MSKRTVRDPWYKVLSELWPVILGLGAFVIWLFNQALQYRQQSSILANQEKRMDADEHKTDQQLADIEKKNEWKHQTQDRQIIENQVQQQAIQQSLGQISEQLKQRR